MIFKPLTLGEFAAIPEATKAKRRQEWERIVSELGRAHYARYHATTDARMASWMRGRAA